MPIANEADQKDFEGRLSTYGLSPSHLITESLSTIRGAKTTLSMRSDAGSRFAPIVLKTDRFEEAAQWLGVPNEARVPVPPVRMPRLSGIDAGRFATEASTREVLANVGREEFTSDQLSQVRSMARAYLRGDSRELATFKPWIEKIFPHFTVPIWAFQEITVESGSVLEFGPGPNVLVAYSLTIESGGVVRAYGDLKVDVTILSKKIPFQIHTVNEALLSSFASSAFRRAGEG